MFIAITEGRALKGLGIPEAMRTRTRLGYIFEAHRDHRSAIVARFAATGRLARAREAQRSPRKALEARG
jgi:hypothetical protein